MSLHLFKRWIHQAVREGVERANGDFVALSRDLFASMTSFKQGFRFWRFCEEKPLTREEAEAVYSADTEAALAATESTVWIAEPTPQPAGTLADIPEKYHAYLAAANMCETQVNLLGVAFMHTHKTTTWCISSRSLGLLTVRDFSIVSGTFLGPVRYNPLISSKNVPGTAYSLIPKITPTPHMWLELRVTSESRPQPFCVYFDPTHAQLDPAKDIYLFESDPMYCMVATTKESLFTMEMDVMEQMAHLVR